MGNTCLYAANPVNYVDRGIVRDLFADQQFTINVDYLEEKGRDAYPEMHLRKYLDRLFFEKMTDWRDESEWRIVAFSRTKEDLFLYYGSALSGIVFGEDTAESTIQAVIKQTADHGVQHLCLKWKNCSPWYGYQS